MANNNGESAVRFASQTEEISPETSLVDTESGRIMRDPKDQEELQRLKSSLQQAVQNKRAEQFSFEPVSLPNSQPVSRVSAKLFSG